jgi:hypothetical protein
LDILAYVGEIGGVLMPTIASISDVLLADIEF